MKKLTLSVDADVIENAHRFARENGTSVSSMFEGYIRLLVQQRRATRRLGPLARKATGMIALPKDRSDRQILEDALFEKHGWQP